MAPMSMMYGFKWRISKNFPRFALALPNLSYGSPPLECQCGDCEENSSDDGPHLDCHYRTIWFRSARKRALSGELRALGEAINGDAIKILMRNLATSSVSTVPFRTN